MSYDQTEATAHALPVYAGDRMDPRCGRLRCWAERPGRRATAEEREELFELVPSARRHFDQAGQLVRGEPGYGAVPLAREVRSVRERMLLDHARRDPRAAKRIALASREVDTSERGVRVIGVDGEIDFSGVLAEARQRPPDSQEPGELDVLSARIHEVMAHLRRSGQEERQRVLRVLQAEIGWPAAEFDVVSSTIADVVGHLRRSDEQERARVVRVLQSELGDFSEVDLTSHPAGVPA